MDTDVQKRAAAERAAGLVEDGMTVGLGSGSTAELMVDALGKRVRRGLHITAVTTSEVTAKLARSFAIDLVNLDQHTRLDMVIDGADEVDPRLNIIKGRGGALLWEKIVGSSTDRYVIIVDQSKLVERLGEHAPLPIEVIRFGWTTTMHRLERLGLACELRGGLKNPFITDSKNYILDCRPAEPVDLSSEGFANAVKLQTGVVEHGLFLRMAGMVIVGTGPDQVTLMHRNAAQR